MGAASEINVNQCGYQKRLDAIHAILHSFDIKVRTYRIPVESYF